MKKVLILLTLCIYCHSTYALDKKGSKQHLISVYGQQVYATEAEMYDLIYDSKYKSYMNLAAQTFADQGIDPLYFMDDIKSFNDCYATAFAKALSVTDFEIIMSNDMSEALRAGIINNIANKEVDKCRDKHQPYLKDGYEAVISEYMERRCGHFRPKKNDKMDDATFNEHIKCLDEAMGPIIEKTGLAK